MSFITNVGAGTGWLVGQGVGGVGVGNFGFCPPGFLALKIDTAGFVLPQKAISFPNADMRKRISLYDAGVATSLTDPQFNGLGKGPSSTIYQLAATTEDHVFYAATSGTASNELFRIKGTGAVSCVGPLTAPSITFPSGGGTPLSYYEEYNHITRFYSSLGADYSGNVTIKLTRIGRQVTAHIPLISIVSTATGTSTIISETDIPLRFRPISLFFNTMVAKTDTTYTIGSAEFRLIGSILLYPTVPGTLYSATGTKAIGSEAFTTTWTV